MNRRFSLQVPMGSPPPSSSDGKIKVDEEYPTESEDPLPFDIRKIENIRSNVKFEQCYEISKHIGDGKFGKVYQVKEKATGLEFAAKFIKIRKEADRAEVEREVSILTHLRHPRIAQIYDAFYTTTNDVVLIMEIVRGGELFDRVADENYVLTETAVVMIICQLCEAIDYIHQQHILHLDIKPENIMCVSQTGNRIKLIDFGLARHYDGTQELKYMAGTPEFAAPEVIKFEKLNFHTDMWSVGVITYILLSGYSPFLGDNLGETYCNVEKGVWEFTEEFDTVSEEAKDFISKLLIYDQSKRMLPHECLVHPWIAGHRAKVQNDAVLEKVESEGPKINNKLMMKYNAKRKFRRMIIYVRFLIEMNRLRSSLKTRMSEHGQKFFDPLLKMADEKEKKVALICPPKKPRASIDLSNIIERTNEEEKPVEPVKLKKKKVINENGEEVLVKKKSVKKKVLEVKEGEKNKDETPSVSIKTVKVTVEGTPIKKKVAKPADDVTKPKTLATTTSGSTTKATISEDKPVMKKKIKRSQSNPREAVTKVDIVLEKKSPSESSITTLKEFLSCKEVASLTIKRRKGTSEPSTPKKNSLTVPTKRLVKKTKSTELGLNDVTKTVQPKKTTTIDISSVVNNKVEKKAHKSDSTDSAKENRTIEEIKPTRQTAIRRKEKPEDNILNNISSLKSTSHSVTTSTTHKSTSDQKNEKVESKLTVKKKSLLSNGTTDTTTSQEVLDVKKTTTGDQSQVKARLIKLNNSDAPLTIHVSSVPTVKRIEEIPETKVVEQKKSKTIPVTTEKKSTTTTATTTSVRRKSSTSEKKLKVQKNGANIEETEKKSSLTNNVKVSQVTTKKEESPETPVPLTSVKKSVIEKEKTKLTSEKKRKEEDKTNVKNTTTVHDKDTDKISIEEKQKDSTGLKKQSSITGSHENTKKMKLVSEGPKKSSLKKNSLTVSEKISDKLATKSADGKKLSASKTCTTKITITPDDPVKKEATEKKSEISQKPKKTSICLELPSNKSSRDSSEERKKVRFAGEVAEPRMSGAGLQKMNSESNLAARVCASVNVEARLIKEEGDIRKKKRRVFSNTEDITEYVPKEDFSFENLKEKLIRRVSVSDSSSKDPKQGLVPIPNTNSVKDRLRQFESK